MVQKNLIEDIDTVEQDWSSGDSDDDSNYQLNSVADKRFLDNFQQWDIKDRWNGEWKHKKGRK